MTWWIFFWGAVRDLAFWRGYGLLSSKPLKAGFATFFSGRVFSMVDMLHKSYFAVALLFLFFGIVSLENFLIMTALAWLVLSQSGTLAGTLVYT